MKKRIVLTALSLVLALGLAACGGTTPTSSPTTSASATPAAASASADASETATEPKATEPEVKLSGDVIVDGSGTVYPLMANIAEDYMTDAQPDVSVQVGRAGSSAGFKKFIPGELDFADASRAIKEEEAAELEARGLIVGTDVLEFKLALDGLTMVINKNNTWATEMTREEVVNMYLSGTFKEDDKVLWSDVRADWPAEEIKFYGPNENHGTYEFFYENILKKEDMVATANLQQEYSTLVDLVSNDKNAIAFFGFGYYVTNTDKLTAVKIDFGNGPVEPTLDTIGEDLAYAGFTRPVFTYLNAVYAQEKPQVLDFAMYVVSPEGAQRLAGANGFAPMPADSYAAYYKQLEALKK